MNIIDLLLLPFRWLRYQFACWLLLHFPQGCRLLPGMFTLVVDMWEGNVDINPDALWAGGVRGVILRINSISGGLHRDDLFDALWAAFSRFIRFPYFVYNPWANAQDNFDWLAENLPFGIRRVAIDIEVKREGYSPATYAAEVDKFIKLCKAQGWLPVIYTGAWFIPLLAYWPKDVPYWWARYPYALYPPTTENITWEQLAIKLDALAWYPAEPGIIPGVCPVWQCSGDRYKLPGTGNRVVDINVANMSNELYREWVGPEPDLLPTQEEMVIALWLFHPELHPNYQGDSIEPA